MAAITQLRRRISEPWFVIGVFMGVLLALMLGAIPAQAARSGSLQVAMQATGTASANGREFTLNYTCTDGQEGRVQVSGSGRATMVERSFAVGTRCTVTGNAQDLNLPGYKISKAQGRAATSNSVIITGAGRAGTTAVVAVDYEAACVEVGKNANIGATC